jgi:hypothetical protein
MSLVYDKGKYNKYFNELEQTKSKNNNPNLRGGMPKKNLNKNPHLYKDFMSTSPIRNINNNNKKTNCLTTYQNNNSSTINNNYYDQPNNRYNKKNLKSHLKYNKSFEGNMINNDNFDFVDDGMYTIQHGSNFGHSKFNNNSVILNNKQLRTKNKNKYNNKSVTRAINSQTNMNMNKNNKKSNFDENMIIKKLDEKFKSLESNIIDKKYENDIDHDEMIISTNKKNPTNLTTTRVRTTNNINSTNYKLSNIIDENNDSNDDYFMNIFDNKNNIDFDENYLLNTSFENNRNDFDIMYTENYEKTVINDMLSLEIKLLIEKMLELQKSYHKELDIIVTQYNKNEKIFKILIEKIKMVQKKLYQIKKLNETKNINGNIYNFLGIYDNNSKHEINNINLNEFYLWKYIMGIQDKKNSTNNKGKLKDLFKKIIFDKYYKISTKVDNIENQIILNLMKKFKYNMNSNKKNGYMNNMNSGHMNSSIDKNKMFTISPFQEYKNQINQNKNININTNINNRTINNKKRHKKTSSCIQSKPGKLTYFRSGKQK